MKTRTAILIDWVLIIALCILLFLTLDVMPAIWETLESFIGENVKYIPAMFIGSIVCFLFYYAVFIKKQTHLSSYVWFIILTAVLGIVYNKIDGPYEKMHLFEYFMLSFLFFKLLYHYLFDTRLYIFGAIFTIVIAVIDETAQSFTPNRTFSLLDIGADFVAALFGQLSIALVIRPRLEIWRFKLRKNVGSSRSQEEWLKKFKNSKKI